MDSNALNTIINGLRGQYVVTQEDLWEYLQNNLVPVAEIPSLLRFESVRNLFTESWPDVQTLPCGLYLQKRSEDRRPAVQIGGRPYRPRGLKWPTCPPMFGTAPGSIPMEFVGQFVFDGSLPSHARLPGNLLLIFAAEIGYLSSDYDDDFFRYEWYQLPFAPDTGACPIAFEGHECVRYDTFDVISRELVDYVKKVMKEVGWGDVPEFYARHILCCPGVKVGGVSAWDTMPEFESLLCSVCSMGAPCGEPYPFIDHAEPIFDFDYSDRPEFTSGDGVLIEFFWSEENEKVVAVPNFY